MRLMNYKGYHGSIDASVEDACLFGKIEFINALVNYEGASVTEIEQAFHGAVDDYLQTCGKLNLEPEKSYKGSFNVRIGVELHKSAMICAKNQDINLNEFVKRSIEQAVQVKK